ncbi:MAG: hypothetical protein IJ268_00125 [Proteobacteria bacterium]|nr:hypothetical protein [Pseudomonadota bacterium]
MNNRRYLGMVLPLVAVAMMAACGDESGSQKQNKPGETKCSADTDCTEAGKTVCNKETGACEAAKPEPDPNACPEGCPENQKCVAGKCVDGNPCTGMDCGEGLACIPVNSTGQCVDVACVEGDAVKSCDAGKVCSKGDCVYEACAKVTCTPGKVCGADGSCAFETAPALVVGAIEKKETSENGEAVDVALKLNHAPSADVTLTCEISSESPNPEASVDCSWVRFSADHWDSEVHLNLIGLADSVVDADQAFTLKVTTVSEDAEFNGLEFNEAFINKNIDKAEILVSRAEIQTSESGDQASFTVVLSSKPTADVTVSLSSSEVRYGIIEGAENNSLTLTFTAENWNLPQTVTVTGVEDGESPNKTPNGYEIVFSKAVSEDANYNDFQVAPVKAANLDNDKAEAFVSIVQKQPCESGEPGSETEDPECVDGVKEIEVDREFDENQMMVIKTDELGTNVMLKLRLGIAPRKPVRVLMTAWDDLTATDSAEAETEVEFSTPELLFDKEDYKTGKLLTVSGKADHIIDTDQTFYIRLRFSSDDDNYNSLAPIWIKCTNLNMDYAGFIKEAETTMVDEDSEMNDEKSPLLYKISLASNPQGEALAEFEVSDNTELKISPKQMTFNSENWNVPQILTVNGKVDDIVDGDIVSQILLKVDGKDKDYTAEEAVDITTVDINRGGINLSAVGGSYREGSEDAIDFDVWLNAKPQENVVVKLVSSNPSALNVIGNTTLSFDSSNWDIHKKVSLKVGADVEENEYVRINLTSYSDEEAFNKLTAVSPDYVILDTSGAAVSLSSAKTTLRPGDYTTTVDVSLSQDPEGSLTVTMVTSNDQTAAIEPKTLTFTSADWDKPQKVNVTVKDPNAAKTAKSVETISALTSTSGPYDKVKPKKDLDVTIYQFLSKNFGYTGGSQSIALKPGTYKFEVWGAQGGSIQHTAFWSGGMGGYSSGILTTDKDQTFYVHVGGAGVGSTGQHQTLAGGYNGGGTVTAHPQWNHYYGSGGGATHIATANGVLSSLKNNRAAIVIVAGGGGGSRDQINHEPAARWGHGKAGGGLSGDGPNAGTQTENSGSGLFGQGENILSQGAGGGGYWGGAWYPGNGTAGGCGGSGYVGTLKNATSIKGTQAFASPAGPNETGHPGHGYARISIAE